VEPEAASDDARTSRIVLGALRDGPLDEFEALLATVEPPELDELAASEHGVAWAEVAPSVVPDDYRLRTLHVVARMHRYDGSATHLDHAAFEQLVHALSADDVPWAEVIVRTWIQLALHVGEASSMWPQARSLLDRFPAPFDASPVLLGAIAMFAASSGAPQAGPLWERVLSHPNLGDRAEQRLGLELDWVRCFLLHHDANPRRAVAVLERVRRGLLELTSPIALLRWTEATFELVVALTWTGRSAEALEVARSAVRRVEPGSELELWLRGIAAYPAAFLGEEEVVDAAFDAIALAAADTSALELRTAIPARMALAARAGDTATIEATIVDALDLEAAQPMDPEARCAWRVHAAEALHACGSERRAADVVADLGARLDEIPQALPVHELRRDALALDLTGVADASRRERIADRCRRFGIDLDSARPRMVSDGAPVAVGLRIRLLGRFDVEHDGQPVPEEAWAGRRQARVLLALLLANGPTVTFDDVIETFWGDVDARTARTRIAPLCNAIRSVLGSAGETTPPRRLLVQDRSITLELHPNDRCDLLDLRTIRDLVHVDPDRARTAALAAMPLLAMRPLANVGSTATAALRHELERELLELAPQLAAAWDGRPAPDEVVAAVTRAHEADPTVVDTCARLIRLHADRGDAPAASSAFHRTRVALRDELGIGAPAALVQLHATVLASSTATT
jgi:DNA-binding SARP family transcriptional activator